MSTKNKIMQLQVIHNKIYDIRGEKIMLDFDLAELYEVETRVFNQAVKRNIENFPKDFMFSLTQKEFADLMSQIVISRSQWGGTRKLPFAFTEHGVAMLASVLKSEKARKMNIAIIRAFIALRKLAIRNDELINLMGELKNRIDEHDVQFAGIYDAIENLLDDKINKQQSWENRERIGFKK
jgi:ORF6N domain